MSPGVRTRLGSTLDAASQAARAKLQEFTLEDLLRAEPDNAEPGHDSVPPPMGIKLHVMEANGI